jgi:hypothetical protein
MLFAASRQVERRNVLERYCRHGVAGEHAPPLVAGDRALKGVLVEHEGALMREHLDLPLLTLQLLEVTRKIAAISVLAQSA